MKLKLLLTILVLGLFVSAFSQSIVELSFSAAYNNLYVPLDNVIIENLTQGGDTMLFWPDTVLLMDLMTGKGGRFAKGGKSFSISQNYPNPFGEKTSFNVNLPEEDQIRITVRDLIGRELTRYENTLKQGNHFFTYYSGSEKYYLLTVTWKLGSKTIKMLSLNDNPREERKCKIIYQSSTDNLNDCKSQKALNSFSFAIGDSLRYTGYAQTPDGINGNNIITDTPETSTNYGFDILKGFRCPETPTITDIDGNVYNTVQIDDQCWMVENLKTTTYNDGTPIPNITDETAWEYALTGAYCDYDNNPANAEEYGRLYNAMAARNELIAPTGWHLPSLGEFFTLANYLGPETAGGQMKEAGTMHWLPPNTGADNSSGFTAVGAGDRAINGFGEIGQDNLFWTDSNHWQAFHLTNDSGSYFYNDGFCDPCLNFGISVRLIRD